jgi:cytosine/adenosine deaminase-related metal-dependent hydrolase
MTTPPAISVLENARIVQHDRVDARPIGLAAGRIAAPAASGFRLDLRDHLIFPGLINAHDHLQLNSIPPLPHAEAFPNSYAWIDVFEAHRRSPDVVAAVAVPSTERHWQGGLKNLLAGVTTVAHHDPWHAVFDDPDFPVGVLRNAGWSHSLGLGLSHRGEAPRYGPPVREGFCATPPTHPWIIHLAEGTDDVARGELARLDDLGCLTANTVIVHGAGMTETDIDRVIARGAAVVWCPASNLGMLGKTLDVGRVAASGRAALGSDSRLTGSRDLLDELRVAAVHSELTPRELLRLVTADASTVLRLPECGSLELGQQGDCVILRAGPDAYGTLLDTSRGAIRAVVRGGVPVIADPDFADWFAHCGVATVPVRLDGRPKLLAERLVRPEAVALEPGLEVVRGGNA